MMRDFVVSGLVLLALPAAAAGPPSAAGPAAGYADQMAHQHAGDAPVASPAAAAEPASPVESSRVTYATIDGKAVEGYLAKPKQAAAGAPGIIVIHEWWGLNENIESMARRLAGEGYTALAVDLYEGQKAANPEDARKLTAAAGERRERLEDNLRQAYTYLEKGGARKVGVIGWCFGGGWSLGTALLLPDKIDAAVVYYGRLVTDSEKLEPLTMPVLGLFGSEDQGIPVASVREFESAMKALGKNVEIHVYEGANHAFANPSGTRYKADAADDAWKKTVAFFAKHLKG